MDKTYILLILLALLVSCDSPIDVQADREIIDLRKDGSSIIRINPENINLDYLLYSKEIDTKFKIENLTSNKLILRDIIFKGNSKFYSLSPNFQLTLKPYESDSIKFTVNPTKFGEFVDTLFFREFYTPYVVIHCFVPIVFCSDIDFGETPKQSTKLQTIVIYNFSQNPIEITDFKFVGDSAVFKIESFNPKIAPLVIPSGGLPRQIIVSFRPEENRKYSANIIFQLKEGELGRIDNVTKLIGTGI